MKFNVSAKPKQRRGGDDVWGYAAASFLLLCSVLSSPCLGQQSHPDATPQILDSEVQALRREVLDIRRELLQIEEELLYPEPARLVVFVSSSQSANIRLEFVSVSLNGRIVSRQQYSAAEARSLREGGVHRAYIGIVPRGSHKLEAEFTAHDSNGADLSARAMVEFRKLAGESFIEFRVEPGDAENAVNVAVNRW